MNRIPLCLLILAAATARSQDIHFPLKSSPNKKYLVDQSGTPVFLNGCCAWRLPYAVSYEEAKFFLLDRKAKKFNAVLIEVSADVDVLKKNADTMPFGANAFQDNDVTKPNEVYF